VSRDTASLSESEVRESAIESLAENLNDSVVAPIFWFVLFGLLGAAVYRFANTADAMWGYRGLRNGVNWEWTGKWAAWADDVLSWLPARITALLLALISGGIHLKALRDEASKTPSPNSGWPMAAIALALGVCLQKPGVCVLNASGRSPEPCDTILAQKRQQKWL
jgi:adenosylcobinamide-phosphate synthase